MVARTGLVEISKKTVLTKSHKGRGEIVKRNDHPRREKTQHTED